jgi:molybdopterin-guanine dinucleotide biosynthesis protein B
MAATFVNLESRKAIRVIARDDARDQVCSYANGASNRHEAERIAYSLMPEESLFRLQSMVLEIPEEDMPGVRGHRVTCSQCGEGINFRREVTKNGLALCIPCYQGGYAQRVLMGDSPPVIHIVGKKNSGKTTLMEKLIPTLSARGYRVGTIKHHHSGRPVDLDWKGKDSWKHRNAGARAVAVLSPAEAVLFQQTDDPMPLSQLVAKMKDVDVVLVEGLSLEARFVIRIATDALPPESVSQDQENLLALVGSTNAIPGVPHFDRDDVGALVDHIQRRVLTKGKSF